jgi:hypothetical protein
VEKVFNLTFHYVAQRSFLLGIKRNAYVYIILNGHYFTEHEDKDEKIAKNKKKKLDRKKYILMSPYTYINISFFLLLLKNSMCVSYVCVCVCVCTMLCRERRNVSFDLYSNICVEFFFLLCFHSIFLSHHFTLEDAM